MWHVKVFFFIRNFEKKVFYIIGTHQLKYSICEIQKILLIYCEEKGKGLPQWPELGE